MLNESEVVALYPVEALKVYYGMADRLNFVRIPSVVSSPGTPAFVE